MEELLQASRLAETLDRPPPSRDNGDLSYTVVPKRATNTYLGSQSLFVQYNLAERSVVGDT